MQRAYVRTDGGLRGSISVYDLVDEMIDVDMFNLSDYLQVREGMIEWEGGREGRIGSETSRRIPHSIVLTFLYLIFAFI